MNEKLEEALNLDHIVCNHRSDQNIKVCVPQVVYDNLTYQIIYEALGLIVQSSANWVSGLVEISVAAKLIENTRFTFQSPRSAKSCAEAKSVKGATSIGDVVFNVCNKSKEKKILSDLYKSAIGDYQAHEIHLNDSMSRVVKESNSSIDFNKPLNLPISNKLSHLASIKSAEMNQMFEILAKVCLDSKESFCPQLVSKSKGRSIGEILNDCIQLFNFSTCIPSNELDELVSLIANKSPNQILLLRRSGLMTE